MLMSEEEKIKWAQTEIATRAKEEYLIGTQYEFGMWRRRRERRKAVKLGKCQASSLIERVTKEMAKCDG